MLNKDDKQSDIEYKYQLFEVAVKYMQNPEKMTFPYDFNFLKYKFTCLEGVCPKGSNEVFEQFVYHLPLEKKKDGGNAVLEIGSGTGCAICSLYLERQRDISRLVATDICPQAVYNTKLNFLRYGIPGEVLLSDVFSGLNQDSKFDLIFWFVPCTFIPADKEPTGVADTMFGDVEYRAVGRFFKEVDKYLTKNGKAVVWFSTTLGNKEGLMETAKRNGKSLNLLWRTEGMSFYQIVKVMELYEVQVFETE